MTLTEFLLARITEDEWAWKAINDDDEWLGGRLLAECEAKRRIVELHGDMNAEWQPSDVPSICGVCHDYSSHDAEMWPCLTLRLLALPYADHADYDKAWRT